MIPLKLHIKNFLSYGEQQTIDFAPYHMICLSGKNGHGKSALLDAMTWALWGQARKVHATSKADHGLLRLGQTQMMVALDFMLNDQTYRVRRDYSFMYGKPYTSLEFGLLDPQTNALIPLTDKTIRATQSAIDNAIRLDFDSFVNSAFLRQGNANEFSKKSAKERKEILANILGLGQYELIRRRALEKIRNYQTEAQTLTALQEKLQQELTIKVNLEEKSAIITQEIAQIAVQEIALATTKIDLETQKNNLIVQQKEYEHLQTMLVKIKEREIQLQEQLRAMFKEWRVVVRKRRSQPDTALLDQKRSTLMKIFAQHQQHLQQSLKVKEELLTYKQAASTLEQTLMQEHAQRIQHATIDLGRARSQIETFTTSIVDLTAAQLHAQDEEKDYLNKLNELNTTLNGHSDVLQQQKTLEIQFDKRKAFYQFCIAQGNMLATELKNIEQKNTLVHDDENPSCPLCEQNVSASRKRFLRQRFTNQTDTLHHRITRIRKVVTNLKELLIEQHTACEALKKKVLEHTGAQSLQAELLQRLQKNQIHQKDLADLTKQKDALLLDAQQLTKQKEQQLQDLHDKKIVLLTANDEYQKLSTAIIACEKTITEIMYNAEAHNAIQRELNALDTALQEQSNIQKLAELQQNLSNTIAQLCSTLKEIKNETARIEHTMSNYNMLTQHIQMHQHQEQLLKKQTSELQIRKEQCIQERATLRAQQEKLLHFEKEIQQHQQKIQQLQASMLDYQSIAHATSKDGIQALLIEEAIPEIEHEANTLLAKLTNNQAHLFIESLRDLKKGGTKETLDIKISDAAGIRPYEMFSGGEAFRIDFALRIAVSKLLARRAGTALQTLIIDEGFGSQDEEGLSHIMDTMYKIQDDFEKIIIVSHLSSLKEQFPVHFVVEKNPSGSIVRIIENG